MRNIVRGRKGFVSRPLEERFWERVDKSDPDGCWLWTGSRAGRGYGRIAVDGKPRPAHRVAWELANGVRMDSRFDACHHCDNPPCVRPDHIFPGTPRDNAADMVAKGRHATPSKGKRRLVCKHGHAVVGSNLIETPKRGGSQCRECKNLYDRRNWHRKKALKEPGLLQVVSARNTEMRHLFASGIGLRELGERFGMKPRSIRDVVKGMIACPECRSYRIRNVPTNGGWMFDCLACGADWHVSEKWTPRNPIPRRALVGEKAP